MICIGGNGLGGLTAAAGTVIRALLPADRRYFTRAIRYVYTAAGTAHTLTAQRALGRAVVTVAVAAGTNVVTLSRDPGPVGNLLATNDLLTIRERDGIQRVYVVSSVAGLAVTLASNLVAGVDVNAAVWNHGVAADTDPRTGLVHPTFPLAASATTTLLDTEVGFIAGHAADEPVLLTSNNATAAGTLVQATWGYTVA